MPLTDISALFDSAWADLDSPGVRHKPEKAEIRDIGDAIDANFADVDSRIAVVAAQGPRALVSGFPNIAVRPATIQQGAGPGRVMLNHTPQTWALHRGQYLAAAASSVAYVDDQDGNDGNAGTSAAPFKTLSQAGVTSQKQIIIVRAGIYAPPAMAVGNAAQAIGPYVKQFFFEPGVVIASPGPRMQDQTWTLHSGDVWKTTLTLTGAQTVHRLVRRDSTDLVANQPLPLGLTYASAAALVAATGVNGWFIDTASGNKVIYARLDGLSVEANKSVLKAYYLDTAARSEWKISGVRCLIQALDPRAPVLFDGCSINAIETGGTDPQLYVDGAFIRYAPESAVHTEGGYTFVARTVAHSPRFDGFNYNQASDGGDAYVVEHDCRATMAGDIVTYGTGTDPNRNGSSAHDDTYILRVGSYYEQNWGPQVAEIANAASGVAWNIGVICGPTAEPQSIGFYTADAGRTSYYDMCHAYGNTTAISAVTGTAKAAGCTFSGATVGTVGTYNVATGA